MEIITLDHQVYQDLVTRINRISDYVFKKAAVPTAEPEIWLTSEELAELLKISTRTLQRMRKERTIPYCMIRSKCLYRFPMWKNVLHNVLSAVIRRRWMSLEKVIELLTNLLPDEYSTRYNHF